MLLNKKNLAAIGKVTSVGIPPESIFNMPERVLQFGTGVFLRGLIDYYIDKANKENVFNGRVVVVKSTSAGDTAAYDRQDGLYTLLMKSVENGVEVEKTVICAAISRILHAAEEWNAIVGTAADPGMQLIISNTTEAGIALLPGDRIDAGTPASFPGKLLAWLLQRYTCFNGSPESGMVILPTELIPGNGTILKNIVNELALANGLDKSFIGWMNTACDFCNTLVDRIVPGKLPQKEHQAAESALGYQDELMIMSETFGLWAIETSSSRTKEILSFSKVNEGIHIVDNIDKFRELKLRLLNGSHNLSCALGFIAGFHTVKEAMSNKEFEGYMSRLILDEIAAAILDKNISAEDALQFGTQVLERYRNPHIEFEWLHICVQDTAKIKIRAVPIVLRHFEKQGYVPDCVAMGFAAYILFMKSKKNDNGEFIGLVNGKEYTIQDDFAPLLHNKWENLSGDELVVSVLHDESLWGTDLSRLEGFSQSVGFYLKSFMNKGFFGTVNRSYMEWLRQ